MRKIILLLFTFSILSCSNNQEDFSDSSSAETLKEGFSISEFFSSLNNRTHRTATYIPKDYLKNIDEKYPLIIYLHGRTSTKVDFNNVGPFLYSRKGNEFNFIVAAPEQNSDIISGGWNPDFVNEFIEQISLKYRVDKKRIYLTGESMGGFGTFRYALKYPEKITAIVALASGISDNVLTYGAICNLKDIPTWIFHSKDDPIVSFSLSENAYNLINDCSPKVPPKFTKFLNYGHFIGPDAYIGTENIYDWMLKYSK